MYKSFVSFDFDFIFQIINTIFLFGILLLIFNFIFKSPRKIKKIETRISEIEKEIKSIKKR
ncbi:MAG: hypothetical protein N4A48_14680 [Tepidibacter sp.]|jgi:F0F1-type ATP synthase membrane subunit b/b'|uniref:hypothetical protein n=1 Tax=Tepidibacter sp. TaxID=2529387 RepID=UPI0025DC890F|nr:hypothetical protein [Tepidibacter sp.]MCT4509974.1 hypothetical protein [Tepidibacter sp.]